MPQTIKITPSYKAISLEDYLKVPVILNEQRLEEEEKIESYKDELEKYRVLFGNTDIGKDLYSQYDNTLNRIGDDIYNNKIGDLRAISKELRNLQRQIKYRGDYAKEAHDKAVERLNSNPYNIGDIGTISTYFNDPNYTPTIRNMESTVKDFGASISTVAASQPPIISPIADDPSKLIWSVGFTPEETQAAFNDATAYRYKGTISQDENPRIYNLSNTMRNILERNNYYNISPVEQQQLRNLLSSTLNNALVKTSVADNPEYIPQAERQRIAQGWARLNAEKDSSTGKIKVTDYRLYNATDAKHDMSHVTNIDETLSPLVKNGVLQDDLANGFEWEYLGNNKYRNVHGGKYNGLIVGIEPRSLTFDSQEEYEEYIKNKTGE